MELRHSLAAAQVHRARDKRTGALVALKTMYLGDAGEVPAHFEREEAALAALAGCPAVVALVGREQAGCAVALVLELCTADLWAVLDRKGGAPLGGGAAKAVLQQLLQALAATHRAGEGAGRSVCGSEGRRRCAALRSACWYCGGAAFSTIKTLRLACRVHAPRRGPLQRALCPRRLRAPGGLWAGPPPRRLAGCRG